MNKIRCEICKVQFLRITNTHLKTRHGITIQKYKEMFPDALIDSIGLANRRVKHLKGKTYTEIYGIKKSTELKKKRSQTTKINWRINPSKISIKKEAEEKKQLIALERKINPPLLGRPRKPEKLGNALCNNCGIEFTYDKNDRSGLFCSIDCSIEYSRRHSTDYRIKAIAHYPYKCDICGLTERLVVHHSDGNRLNNDISNLRILCPTCHRNQHKSPSSYRGVFSDVAIERGVRDILSGLRVDLRDSNFVETPKRVAKMFAEVLEGLLPESKEEIKSMLSKTFPCDTQDMVIIKDICCWSMCPHHLLPVKYAINIGYIPDKKVLGLSKIPRLAILLAKRPVLQEQLVHDISTEIEKNTNAKGVIVNILGEHMCMQMRGVKAAGASAEATAVTGYFKENKDGCKDEFISRIRR